MVKVKDPNADTTCEAVSSMLGVTLGLCGEDTTTHTAPNTRRCSLSLYFTPRNDLDVRFGEPSSSSMYLPKPPIFLLLQDSNDVVL